MNSALHVPAMPHRRPLIRVSSAARVVATASTYLRRSAVVRVALALALMLTNVGRGAAPCQDEITPGQYNVIVIVLDDLGTDQLGFYGENTIVAPTPNLDALVAGNVNGGGILFTRAYGDPVCSPTRACIQTGRYGYRNGCGNFISAGDAYRVPLSELFLPEVLRGAHSDPALYASGAFGKWHLARWDDGCPLGTDACDPADQGYDRYDGVLGNLDHPVPTGTCMLQLTPPYPVPVPRGHYYWPKVTALGVGGSCSGTPTTTQVGAPPPSAVASDWTATVTTDDAVGWITTQSGLGQPYFAYIAYSVPHVPPEMPPEPLVSNTTSDCLYGVPTCTTCPSYYPPPVMAPGCPFVAGERPGADPAKERLKLIYRASIEALDAEIGRLFAQLADAEALANTMIFVIGDNGSGAGVIQPPQNDTHGKRTIFEGGIHVPLIVSGPLVPSGSHVSDVLVGAVDLFRTVLNVTALSDAQISAYVASQYPTQHKIDSISFLDEITQLGGTGARDHVYSETFANASTLPATPVWRAVIHEVGGTLYKLHHRPSLTPPFELYQIAPLTPACHSNSSCEVPATNLWNDPAHTAGQSALTTLMARYNYQFPER